MAPFATPAATQSSFGRFISAPRHRSAEQWWHDPEQMIEDEHK